MTCECGCKTPIRIGTMWCRDKGHDKDGYYWAGYTWSGYVGEGWPLHWRRKREPASR